MFKKIITIIAICFSIIILWCSNWSKTIQIWDKVTLTYSANFQDWSIFQSWNTIIDIIIWSWEVVKWIENWIIWMKSWEEKEIIVTPENWYAKDYDPTKIQKITKIIFDRIWLKPEIWNFYKIWDLEGIIKEKEWSWDFQIFMLDTNSRNTYENIIYKIKIAKITR